MTTIRISEQERNTVSKLYDPTNGVNFVTGVSSITRSGSVATAIIPDHGIPSTETVVFAGADQTEYNVSAAVTVVDKDTVTYTVAGTPATPATGTITASHANQSRAANLPKVLQIGAIAAATTLRVEACIRRALGWQQVGADLTNADNGKLVPIAAQYNFVRIRRSSGSGAADIYVQS